jgi:predicted aspartyl protease
VARIEGTITEDDEILIDGYLFKDNIKIETSFVIDTGFKGYDIAIPADIAARLNLNPHVLFLLILLLVLLNLKLEKIYI